MATLMELLGAAYREGMTLAEVETALADCDVLTRAAAEELATQRSAATKRLLDTANRRLNEANNKNNATGNELADALARIATLENNAKENERSKTIAEYKASFLALGYSETLAAETAEAMADNNMATVLLNQGKAQAAREQAMKDEWKDAQLKGTQPPAAGGNSSPTIDYAKAKADALAAGNDALYMALCQQEVDAAK